MHKLTFFPLGNADCCRIDLANGRKILFDYAAMRDPEDENDRRIDLPAALREDLDDADRDDYDVVAFTHLDMDHIKGAPDFFWLEHAEKYQGEDRIKIRELWVPAAVITERGPDDKDAKVIQAEARHRLEQGQGIRVFSRPERLKDWLEERGLTLEDRKHLITDAGNTIPDFTLEADEVEFFVHSPFAVRQDENTVEDRNTDSLALHATFVQHGRETKVLFTSDINHEVIADIVRVTRQKGNEDRLEWDVVGLPHHCSYLSLGPEKGKDKTEPVPEVEWLYEEQGRRGGILVSTSWEVPSEDTDQPPHRQAAAYYEEQTDALGGEFKVTMEHPKASAPEPLVIKIDGSGAAVEKRIAGGAAAIVSRPAPRAGRS